MVLEACQLDDVCASFKQTKRLNRKECVQAHECVYVPFVVAANVFFAML